MCLWWLPEIETVSEVRKPEVCAVSHASFEPTGRLSPSCVSSRVRKEGGYSYNVVKDGSTPYDEEKVGRELLVSRCSIRVRWNALNELSMSSAPLNGPPAGVLISGSLQDGGDQSCGSGALCGTVLF